MASTGSLDGGEGDLFKAARGFTSSIAAAGAWGKRIPAPCRQPSSGARQGRCVGGLTRGRTAGTMTFPIRSEPVSMGRVHFRIIAALFALSVLAAAVLGALWVYRETIEPERQRKQEIAELLKKKGPRADPGKKLYEKALAHIRANEMDAARERLTEVIDVHRDSERWEDARRVLGEMNMDRLFSRVPMPGKLEYTVGRTRQDNLNAIAGRFRSTIGFIKRVNNLLGNVIHPGDRLVLYPLDFELEVDLQTRRLTLRKDGRFFKEYAILGHHLPYPSLPETTTVADTPGWIDEKKIRPDDERYAGAVKWLQTPPRGQRSGIVFCPQPPAPAEGQSPTPSGIYLSGPDLDELATVVRPGSPLRFLKKS